jgi:Na+/H+ antiporter NhaB
MNALLIVTACIAWFTAGLIAGWILCRRKCLQILALAMAHHRRRS